MSGLAWVAGSLSRPCEALGTEPVAATGASDRQAAAPELKFIHSKTLFFDLVPIQKVRPDTSECRSTLAYG